MRNLKDKEILKVHLATDKQTVAFEVKGEEENRVLVYKLYHDCCSEGWIEHISVPFHYIGFFVTEVEEVPPIELTGTVQEEDTLYGVKLHSRSERGRLYDGYIYLEFRNSSNGYYGSSVDFKVEESLEEFSSRPFFEYIKESF